MLIIHYCSLYRNSQKLPPQKFSQHLEVPEQSGWSRSKFERCRQRFPRHVARSCSNCSIVKEVVLSRKVYLKSSTSPMSARKSIKGGDGFRSTLIIIGSRVGCKPFFGFGWVGETFSSSGMCQWMVTNPHHIVMYRLKTLQTPKWMLPVPGGRRKYSSFLAYVHW